MVKYLFIIRSPESLDRDAFKSRIFNDVVPQLLQLNPEKLKVGITEFTPPRFTILPLKATGLALVSVWGDFADAIGDWRPEIASMGGSVAGYQVTESTPVAYDKTWEDGNASPGAVLLTLMKKNAKLGYEQFMSEWFGHHTPMAIRIHPLWNYIRNVVESTITEDSPPFDGIVEEHFRSLRDITNPARFFGGVFKMLPNMIKVGLHSNKFLDLSATENYLLTEFHIRS